MVVRSIHVAMILYVRILNVCCHVSGKITLSVTVGVRGVAGEGRVVGVLKFNSWGKCTMPLMNISSDWNIIFIVLFTWVLYFASWDVINLHGSFISHLGV